MASNPRVVTVLIGACAVDGPLPIGELLALTALGAIIVYEWVSDQDCLICGANESRIGGSGKPRRHIVKHPTRKKAQDAAQADSSKGSAPEQHANPTKGEPHYHPGGKKHRSHHTYPGGGFPKNKPY